MCWKEQLVGKWISADADKNAGEPRTSLEFRDDGTLTYTIHGTGGKEEIIRLTFTVDGEYLITDQPSRPSVEKTRATLLDGKLCLDYEGHVTCYTKETPPLKERG
jgi:hypothetical protein